MTITTENTPMQHTTSRRSPASAGPVDERSGDTRVIVRIAILPVAAPSRAAVSYMIGSDGFTRYADGRVERHGYGVTHRPKQRTRELTRVLRVLEAAVNRRAVTRDDD